tara:strand:- start:1017 stop:2132 length:1116 start_codon:yes stop_codon:yes gene_type:complete
MKKILNIAIALLISSNVQGQDLNSYYSYLLNWYNVNPAYTGNTEGVEAMLNSSTQWVGFDGSPNNSMFGIHSGLNDKMGIGGKINIDTRGVFTNFSAEMNYAYKFKLTENSKLNFGVTVGLFQSYINTNSILDDKYTDESDQTITSDYYNSSHFISSFGALYEFKGLEVGVSAPHMAMSKKDISDHVFGMAKYSFDAYKEKLDITPSVVYQNLSNSPNQLDAGLAVKWDETVEVKYIYRSNNTMVFGGGLHFDKVNFGFAYVRNFGALNVVPNGSYEVYVAFRFDKKGSEKSSKTTQSKGESTSKLSSILSELKSITSNSKVSEDVKAEINSIQNDLSALIDKAKTEDLSKTDQQSISDLENRISKLKNEL